MEKSKMYFWDVLSLFILVLIVFVVAFAMPGFSSWKNSFAPARTITVSAQGMTTASPDMAEISFSVVSQGQSPQALSDSNNAKMSAVLQFVAGQKIASSDISTTGYDLEPNYQYDRNTSRNLITGYTLTQTVQVKIRDIANVATVLGGLAPLGVNQIGGVSFTFQNPDEFVAIARGQALTNAYTEAAGMVAQAGASLGNVVTINETPNVPLPFAQNGYASGAGMSVAMAPVPAAIQPGTQDVTDQVTVTYALN